MLRLNSSTLSELADDIAGPTYDRDAIGCGIVHLGIGGFHRAHQALYTDTAIAMHGGDWGITGVCMRSATSRDELAPQDGLYCVVSADNSGEQVRVIGSVKDVMVAPESPAAVVAKMADPSVHVITLTVTEKGYCLGSGWGLDMAHPDISHDIANPDKPRSAPGLIAAALRARALIDVPVTVLSCDNLSANGARLHTVVRELLTAQGASCIDWVDQHCTFPSSMVDRIVPEVTPALRERVSARLGLEDLGCVLTEPFMQWVIEDRFAGSRPAWDAAGALLVDDVEPFETAKLRMLNGSHSAVAYLGALAGFEFVHEAMAEPWFHAFVERLMRDEIAPTVDAPAGLDLPGYAAALRDRFANAAVPYATAKVASDGSQKIPQRLVPVLKARLAQRLPVTGVASVIAAWIRYVSGTGLDGCTHAVADPMRDRLAALASVDVAAPGRVAALFALPEIFGTELATDDHLLNIVARQLEQIERVGVQATVQN